MAVLGKHEIEAALHSEHQEIRAGRLKEDSPLDLSDEYRALCEACRRGDLKGCQEKLQEGVNINARDKFDYTPLILASLCGHYEVVQLLLESGALCERDTFQGERCLYNALNDRIRNLLLSYDYSKSRDPLQPFAGHITSLLNRTLPQTSDITLHTDTASFRLHKFILAARSPYFARKLAAAPETIAWRVPASIPSRSVELAIVMLYLGEINHDFDPSDEEDQAVLAGLAKLGRQLEVAHILETILESDRRLARQRRTEEVERCRQQFDQWFRDRVLANRLDVESRKADEIKWDRQNAIFADVLLCADGPEEASDDLDSIAQGQTISNVNSLGIPIGPSTTSRTASPSRPRKKSTLFPVHRAMLLRSEYFAAMFSSSFREAQPSEHLPVVHLECSADALAVVLIYLYTEQANFGLDVAIEVLFTADQLFIERLKVKAGMIISTLGNGTHSTVDATNARGDSGAALEDVIDIYDVVRAGWDTRVPRLEEFGARYMAYRLERYIDEPDFKELVRESAARIQNRQETDTVELIDDIRHYLSERFRLRFEDAGFDDLLQQDMREQAQLQCQSLPADASEGNLSDSEVHVENDTKTDQATLQSWAPQDDMVIRTLDGEIAGDEFSQDALNYQILLGKIDLLLESLTIDA